MARGIEFRCPHCSNAVRVPADLAGQAGRCPSCEGMLRVPDTPANVDLSSQSARNPFAVAPSMRGSSQEAAPRVKPTWLELAAVAIAPLIPCLGMLLGIVALIVNRLSGRSIALPGFAIGLATLTGLIYAGIVYAIQLTQ